MDDAPSPLAPLPESFSIPAQSLEAWNRLPSTDYVHVRFTKSDIDHLFFAVDKIVHATDATNAALTSAMSGNTEMAYTHIHSSTARLILSALMACAQGVRGE